MENQILPRQKREMFDSIESRLSSYMEGRVLSEEIAGTFNYILIDEFRKYNLKPIFVGQYKIDESNPLQTRVFSWQGTEACSPIPINRGVIGRAIRTGKDQYVPDVTKDQNHVGCDPNMEGSELVLLSWSDPYISPYNKKIMAPLGVLDLDFNIKNALEKEDMKKMREIWDVYGKQIFPGIPKFLHQKPISYKIAV